MNRELEARVDLGEDSGSEMERLPIHLPTKLLALTRHWRLVPPLLALSFIAAILLALAFGKRIFHAETVLLFSRAADSAGEMGKSTYLLTQLHTVKLPEHLEELRSTLSLEASAETLGQATGAFLRRDTGLLVIDATWSSAEGAADLANTLREIFLRTHVSVMARNAAQALDQQIEQSRKKLREVEVQLERLGGLEGEIRQRIATDLRTRPEQEGLGDINIRVERLRDAIIDDQKIRWNVADLAKRRLELERAEKLVAEGLVSASQRDQLAAEVAKQAALTVDTEETEAWKKELDRLLAVALPSESATSPSAPVLQEIMLNDFHLRLDRERCSHLLQRLLADRVEIEKVLDGAAAGAMPEAPEALGLMRFQVLSAARAPAQAERSNRKLVAVAAFVFLVGAGLVLIVLRELVDTRLRSAAECRWLTERPVLAAYEGSNGPGAGDAQVLASLLESYRAALICGVGLEGGDDGPARLAERLRAATEKRGRRAVVIAGESVHSDQVGDQTGADLVLVVAPTASGAIDGATVCLARELDATLLLTSAGKARCGVIRTAIVDLERWATPILGLVLDHVEARFIGLKGA